MTVGISMMKLLYDLHELPAGIYVAEISRKATSKTYWLILNNADGVIINAVEKINNNDNFDYEIYSQTFMEDAFRFYNHELDSQL